jgi:hypothetical protein
MSWARAMKRAVMLLLLSVACRATDGTIERHGSNGPGPGPAPKGEYGDDPGEADAKQDFAFTPPDDPDGGVEEDAAIMEDAGADGPASIPLEEAPGRIARLTCQRRLGCCKPDERSGLPDDPAACEQELSEQLAPSLQAFARSVAAGRATYDDAALTRCLAALEAADCPEAVIWEPLLAGPRCGFAAGALPAGDDCQASYECMAGFCQGAAPGRDGRCVSPRLADGQPCDRAEDCASGACHPLLDVCAAAEPGNICD